MTSGVDPDFRSGERQWAAELLGVEPTATPTEARRAYFRKLHASKYLPSQSLSGALHVFDSSHGTVAADEERLQEMERHLRAAVDSFAGAFFSLSPPARQEIWATLLSQCRGSLPLAARLQALQSGLAVEPPSLSGSQPYQGELATLLLHTFPLSPLAKATARQAFLRRLKAAAPKEKKVWELAARSLTVDWPALAGLDRDLLRTVATLRQNRKGRLSVRTRWRLGSLPTRSKKAVLCCLVMLGVSFGAMMRSVISSNNSSAALLTTQAPQPRPKQGDLDKLFQAASERKAVALSPLLPRLNELLDASKYDVALDGFGELRRVRFTPRAAGARSQPLSLSEAQLKLLGCSPQQLQDLYFRTARKKHPNGAPKSVD